MLVTKTKMECSRSLSRPRLSLGMGLSSGMPRMYKKMAKPLENHESMGELLFDISTTSRRYLHHTNACLPNLLFYLSLLHIP